MNKTTHGYIIPHDYQNGGPARFSDAADMTVCRVIDIMTENANNIQQYSSEQKKNA
jgi:hypothetical protein